MEKVVSRFQTDFILRLEFYLIELKFIVGQNICLVYSSFEFEIFDEK